MKHLISIFLITTCLFLTGLRSAGQIVTVTNPANATPALAATYGSLALAITAVDNITTISGPVIITLNPSNNQTAPAGGYTINFTAATTAVNNITIEGSGNTISAFTPQPAGQIYDAIFKIIGSDYVTIQNFVMRENPLNSTVTVASNNMTEWGVALLYASPTNGAQNNTIQNNTISLNKNYSSTFGIYSNTNHTATIPLTLATATSTAGANSGNKIYANAVSNVNMGICFVGSQNINYLDIGNDIGGNSLSTGNIITNWGGLIQGSGFTSSSGSCYGINLDNQKGENASYNTITSAAVSGTAVSIRGIFKDYNNSPTGTFISSILNNTITINNNFTSAVTFECINSRGISAAAAGATININSNVLLNNNMGAATTPNFIAITNSCAAGIVNINNNIIRGTTAASTSGNFTGISNNAAVTATLNINNNKIGDASGNAISYSVASTANLTGITVPSVGAAASVSISNNNFQGFAQSMSGTGAHTYINLYHPANTGITDNINNNTFTNLTANTSGNVTFITRDGTIGISSGAVENCKNNAIVTGFSKPTAGSTVTLYAAFGGTLSGNSMVQTGNNFSNITLTGATGIAGWVNYEGGGSGPVKTFTNNTFTNWICGSVAANVVQSGNADNGTSFSNNTISNISGTGGVTAISLASSNKGAVQLCSGNIISDISGGTGNAFGIVSNTPAVSTLKINSNKISGLSSSVTGTFAAIRIINGALVNLAKNKIYDISGNAAGSIVFGIDVQSTNTGTINIYNNCIGDLRAALANNINAIRGIIISSTSGTASHNIYYNSIYLNASSTGSDFGTSGVYVLVSGTATNGPTTLRNNIIINTSAANGTGLTVAYRRNGVQLNNYASASNNNIFYAGTASPTNLIFNDGTNGDQTLAAYKTRVSTRDAASFTELVPFLSTAGSSPDFLHLDPAVPTQAESGAANISGYTDDHDSDIRQGNSGYTGTGTAPDIGADETEAIFSELIPPIIAYTTISSPSCIFSGMTLSGVTITDATGVPLSGATRPRIYYRKNAGPWFSSSGTNTSGTSTNSVWSFSIVEANLGGVAGADVISYYVIAQDLNPVPNLSSNPSAGLMATSVNNVSTHPTTPNTYTMKYSLNGTYTVGTGGNFPTLTAAVNAYNTACSISGPTIFELTDNSYPSEIFPIDIQLHPDASAAHTLTIRPSATATPVITGAVATTQVINLNGARYIIFDGRQGGSGTARSLTISNTSNSGNTVQFINDAQYDVFKYCIIRGMRTSSFNGTILFSTASASGTGNDNNTLDNNDITDAGGQSTNGICSVGTAGKENDNIFITNNNISNYFNAANDSRGIYISSSSNSWTITGNRFFQTTTRLYTSSLINWGIYITTGTGYTINNNTFGFANSAGTGTTNLVGNSVSLTGFPSGYTPTGTAVSIRYVGIGLSLGLIGTASSVDGNTIAGIAMYTSNASASLVPMFCGIYVESGTVNIGANAGNTIGSASGNNAVYVATGGAGGAVYGIKTNCLVASAIQNNVIGSITISGSSAAVSGSFTGISAGGPCNYTITNNSIGNTEVDNIRIGYALAGGLLSNAGTLTATNAGVTTVIRGITSGSSGNALSITNNTLCGWLMSCMSAPNLTGIETTGIMSGGNPSVNVNNNSLGTASVNWVNAIVDNSGTFYGINMSNSNATVTNIKDNDFRGAMFGTQNGVGGGFIKLTGASSANNVATISGNTFTNLSFRFSAADLYFIFTNYTISATGQLMIDNNKIVGSFTATGNAVYHVINLFMSSAAGAKADITNNNFSNAVLATGFTSNVSLLFTSFGVNPCLLTVSNNAFNGWSFGSGFVDGIDISDMTGTATCSNNIISNITGFGYMTGITVDGSGSSGQFNVINNNLSGLVSTGAGGFINGIAANISPVNATQTVIDGNTISGLSSTNVNGDVAGIYLDNGFAASTVSVTKNKIYNLSESGSGSNVYGITNYTSLKGVITYSNNYIGDLRAPLSGVAGPAVTGMKLYMLNGQAKVFYNTIHLNATGSAAGFSTAAVYADAATALTLRNNIFSNTSGHGSTGKTVAYWRADTNLNTYDPASNNNLFYAGTASSQNLIYYDGSNSDQLLTTYKARVTPGDNLSVSALPVFISTVGANVNFLHLAGSGNCSVNAAGNNAGILLLTDYDNDLRSTSAPFVTDIGADEFSKKNAWTGANGTSWNDAVNWSEGIVPDSDDDNVVISNPPVNQPVIAAGESYQTGSVIIGAGAGLTNYGTIKIAGSVYAVPAAINNIQAGSITGSVEMNGNCSMPQSLAGNIFVSNSVRNLIVSNDLSVSSVAGEDLNISRALSFGAVTKTLVTGDNIVLLSSASATANVADVTGNNISGKVIVERCINTGVSGGQHLKGWQFLATPTQGQTIFQSWQEGGLTPAGYGTIITGTGSGFDFTTSTPSMKYYDPLITSNGAWVGVTTTAGLLNDQRGYMLFVRGDRTVTTLGGPPNTTNMRSKGTLYQPNNPPPLSTVPAGKYTAVGNPYASAINLNYMAGNNLFVNLNNDVVVWDPLLYGSYGFGGYQTLSAANNYEPTAGGTAYYAAGIPSPFIQSGQAFFVQSSGLTGSVTFTEACKDGSNRLVNRLTDAGIRRYFRAALFTDAGFIADGNAVVFDDNYSNDVDADDAGKFVNAGENFMISRHNKKLSVETRRMPETGDTIFYSFSNLRKQPYQLRFAPKNFDAGNLQAFLVDKYLQTTTELNLTDSNFINITVNTDSLSSVADRFFVIFKHATIVPVNITGIAATRNQDKTISVKWTCENEVNIERYSLQKSADGQNFTEITSKRPLSNNGGAVLYVHTDLHAFDGNNFYRVKATGLAGEIRFSAIVKVAPLNETASITVYPNPVENKTINLHFVNQVAGVYKLQLNNRLGQLIYQGSIEIHDENISREVVLDKSIASGNYQLSVQDADGKKSTLQIIIR